MNDIVQHEQTRVGVGAEEGMRRDSGGEMVLEGDLGILQQRQATGGACRRTREGRRASEGVDGLKDAHEGVGDALQGAVIIVGLREPRHVQPRVLAKHEVADAAHAREANCCRVRRLRQGGCTRLPAVGQLSRREKVAAWQYLQMKRISSCRML
jgi:hypothetical protein